MCGESMSATEQPAENRPNSRPRQEVMELDLAPEPGNIVLLRNLVEIRQLWGHDEKTVYRAVRKGQLRAYGRPGRQKYYSEAELMHVFGEPTNRTQPPAHNRARKSNGVTGGQLSFDEIATAAAAA